jgi:biotin transport system substrate-specific component
MILLIIIIIVMNKNVGGILMYKLNTRDLTYIAFFAALTGMLSYVTIPLPLVPITLQTLAVMMAGSLLTPKQAGLSMFVFLSLGAIGIPVFAGGHAGIGMIVGPTGGYLVGFLIGAVVISLLRGKTNNKYQLIFANIIGGIFVVYLIGVPWLSFMTHMSLAKAFVVGGLYFIPSDLIKAVVASVIAIKLNRHIKIV